MDVLKLNGDDLNAGTVLVEDLLQKHSSVILDFQLAVRDGGVNEVVADDFTHGCFGCAVHEIRGISHIEQVKHGVLDFVLNGELDVDHVLIAGEHGGLMGHHAHAALLEGCGLADVAVADLAAHDARDLRLVNGFDGHRQGVVRSWSGGTVVFAELQHYAFLVRIDDVDAGGKPEQNDDAGDKEYSAAAGYFETGDPEAFAVVPAIAAATSVSSPEGAEGAAFFAVIVFVVTGIVFRRRCVTGLAGALFLQLVPVPVLQNLRE